MAETAIDVRGLQKPDAYQALERHARSVLEGVADPVAIMATISCLVHEGFGHLWVGFYRVVEPDRLLRVGPYQGSLGCLEIRFGRGVCGTAAIQRQTILVPDVHAFPGHITCDARARSEIVVPVFDGDGRLIAVFDVDSELPSAFDHNDAEGLEHLLTIFSRQPPRVSGTQPDA